MTECEDRNRDTCRPVELMADKWMADYVAHAKSISKATELVNALATRLDEAMPKIDRAITVCTVLEARYPVLKETGEATLHELGNVAITAHKALAQAEDAARSVAKHEARAIVANEAPRVARKAVQPVAWIMAAAAVLSAIAAVGAWLKPAAAAPAAVHHGAP